MTEKELLAVLDMTEEEQCNWLSQNTEVSFKAHLTGQESLADLAFRLRDEVIKTHNIEILGKACWLVYLHRTNFPEEFGQSWTERTRKHTAYISMFLDSQPEDWIIAALIAKSKEKE